MSPKLLRLSLRTLHLALAIAIGWYIYGPGVPRSVAQILLVPALGLTGGAMWQLARLRRALRHDRPSTILRPKSQAGQ